MVGVGTVIRDDPELTVRMVSGASPMRVVLDTTLRIPADAKILGPEAATTVITTERSDPDRRAELRERGVRVEVVAEHAGRVSIPAALATLRTSGTESVLVEGGAEVITALLAERLVDRIIVGVAPIVIGAGTEAVELPRRRSASPRASASRTARSSRSATMCSSPGTSSRHPRRRTTDVLSLGVIAPSGAGRSTRSAARGCRRASGYS